MMKKIFMFLLFLPLVGISQTQIGSDINGKTTGDATGTSVALSSDGSIVVIGSPHAVGNTLHSGYVQIFENISGVWTQIGQDIYGDFNGDAFGRSVAISSDGSIVAIGTPYNNGNGMYSGLVRVFKNISGIWTQIGQDIVGDSHDGGFIALSSDGSIVAIGAEYKEIGGGIKIGHTKIYENINGIWTQIGQGIEGETQVNFYHSTVALSADGSILAIGASTAKAINGNTVGNVKIYENISGIWTQIGQDIEGRANGHHSGASVALSADGKIVAIGAPDFTINPSVGYVRIYENNSGVWTQIGQDIEGDTDGDLTGTKISLSSNGKIIAISAPYSDGNGILSGTVRIYENISGQWTQAGSDIDGKSFGDLCGIGVSLSSNGNVVAIGSPTSAGSGKSGHVRVYNLSSILSSDDFILENFNVYPNPATDVLNIDLENDLTLEKVTVYNYLGQVVKVSKEHIIAISTLAKGIYFVEVTTPYGKATKKVVVK